MSLKKLFYRKNDPSYWKQIRFVGVSFSFYFLRSPRFVPFWWDCLSVKMIEREREITKEVMCNPFTVLTGSSMNTFIYLINGVTDDGQAWSYIKHKMPGTDYQLNSKSNVHDTLQRTVLLCLLIGFELYQMGVHKRAKRIYVQRPLETQTGLQYIIPHPFSEAFVNKKYLFLHCTNDSTLTLPM